MIRKPIAPLAQFVLGAIAFCAVIAAYTVASNWQYQKNPRQVIMPGWTNSQQVSVVQRSLTEAQASLQSAEAASDAVAVAAAKSDIAQFEGALKQVEDGYAKSMLGGLKQILVGSEDQPTEQSSFSDKLRSAFDNGWLWSDFGISFKRFAYGMLLGTALGFVIGIAMGCFTPIEALLRPLLAFFSSIPPTAMIAVYMLIFKLKPELFIAVIGIGIFPVLAQAIYQAVKNDVPEAAVNKAYTLGASHFEVIWEVVIPQILPRIIDAIRLQIGPAMIFLIAVELYVGSEGIGYRLKLAPRGSHYNVIYIYLILLGVLGMLVDWAMIGVRRWWCPWFEGSTK